MTSNCFREQGGVYPRARTTGQERRGRAMTRRADRDAGLRRPGRRRRVGEPSPHDHRGRRRELRGALRRLQPDPRRSRAGPPRPLSQADRARPARAGRRLRDSTSHAPRVDTMAFLSILEWKFLLPIAFGDTLRVITRVHALEPRSRGRRGVVTWHRRVINQSGQTWSRRGGPRPSSGNRCRPYGPPGGDEPNPGLRLSGIHGIVRRRGQRAKGKGSKNEESRTIRTIREISRPTSRAPLSFFLGFLRFLTGAGFPERSDSPRIAPD